jgi:mRNA interferase RelE/StbE
MIKNYEVVLSKTAEKNLMKMPAKIVKQIIPTLQELANNPRPAGCKKLKGFSNIWRVRVGDYRIIYSIEDQILLVDIREIGHRKEIYK